MKTQIMDIESTSVRPRTVTNTGSKSSTSLAEIRNSEYAYYVDDDSEDIILERTTGQLICIVLTDILIVVFLLTLNCVMYHHLLKTNRTGFFCSDTSIRLPYLNSTVGWWSLVFGGAAVNLVAIVSIELLNHRLSSTPMSQFRVGDWHVPQWIVEIYKYCGVFVYGIAAQFLVVGIMKKTIGRLRPYFIVVCEPQPDEGTDCGAPENFFKYISHFTCRSDKYSPKVIEEARLSFPSGHAAYCAYTCTFCVLYLQTRLRVNCTYMLKPGLQIILICVGVYVCISRVMDNKHHWSDVLVGFLIALFVAVFAIRVADQLKRSKRLVRALATEEQLKKLFVS